MKIIKSPQEMQSWSRGRACEGKKLGFVPTMGALHAGHLALCERAKQENDGFAASIFVNPTQFGANEDLKKYPRPFERDCELLQDLGCEVLFAPETDAMYQKGGTQTWVEVARLGEVWEGVVRPGHLRGVATVVAKLFNIVQPARAYFGEKDFQQLKVIEHLARDLNFSVEIVPCETVREADGLALSSRNAYLAPDEREAALFLSQALFAARDMAQNGERDAMKLGATMQEICERSALVAVQYIAVVEEETLAQLETLQEHARALIAARVGSTRIIDNIRLF
ncbi:MAG TPA: pantoate--beta-alanine ligase [Abditibacteriaceae bacterium]|jgi:pantoate--beta-alanine ligase